ncbi:DUF4376 domain-containing protein [Salmonella enterica]|uniref:DUF4376 domain-containing protein n=2 Tax=Salmonella enterica TaxID=28901 RepID=A0A612C607_SALMO|nr:DUF4376 domain-containing protein [Salmonella enterica]EBY2761895.1 DUF4376 domain-containing protein [Salmonella enterica subsp. enterica serovar Gaminara]EBY4401204.1 DUF4376 domain-containing protein [Salmonella enterica subsp. enterica serovar Caracas]ECV9758220.1 DUF4376 domain-containing protein [Salmonella enterica subsp. enterica serovar Montevideo]EEG7823127.1 DUF4376 domain-containing protein [Salmonella enterica]
MGTVKDTGVSDEITAVRNAAYDENGSILVEVKLAGRDWWMDRMVTKNETSAGARRFFADLVAGKYGPVTPFTATPEMIRAAKDRKRSEINAWRDEQENGSYLFQYNGHRWDYGKATQDRMSISLAMAKKGLLPEGFAWTDGDNNIVPVTNDSLIALAGAIEQAMFEKGVQINQRQLQMKSEVEALTALPAIRAYRPGWPDGTDITTTGA